MATTLRIRVVGKEEVKGAGLRCLALLDWLLQTLLDAVSQLGDQPVRSP